MSDISITAEELPIVQRAAARIEAQRLAELTRRRWFWLSWLPRLFVLWQIFKLGLLPFQLYLAYTAGNVAAGTAPDRFAILGAAALNILLAVIGIAIGIWAYRYCIARSEGRIQTSTRPRTWFMP
jgi:hypothetical protein